MKSYTVTITSSGQITLPAEIRRQLGVKPGEQVTFEAEDHKVEVKVPEFTWRDARGFIKGRNDPRDIEAMIQVAKDERADRFMEMMREN